MNVEEDEDIVGEFNFNNLRNHAMMNKFGVWDVVIVRKGSSGGKHGWGYVFEPDGPDWRLQSFLRRRKERRSL